MTKQNAVYKCEICGNIVEVLHTGAGDLVCCGQNMILLEEKSQEEGTEKHLPVIEKLEGVGVKIKVGEVPHPMEEAHYVEWIEVRTADGKIGKKFLSSGDSTEVEFHAKAEIVEVRAYCNVHGLWKITV